MIVHVYLAWSDDGPFKSTKENLVDPSAAPRGGTIGGGLGELSLVARTDGGSVGSIHGSRRHDSRHIAPRCDVWHLERVEERVGVVDRHVDISRSGLVGHRKSTRQDLRSRDDSGSGDEVPGLRGDAAGVEEQLGRVELVRRRAEVRLHHALDDQFGRRPLGHGTGRGGGPVKDGIDAVHHEIVPLAVVGKPHGTGARGIAAEGIDERGQVGRICHDLVGTLEDLRVRRQDRRWGSID
mmetsp:Transcript_7716/g.18292  ORF Transcript_7716/g.18292 Transcript_7716/m.18292 type:complete len:238 (+) Transcript_7716:262-975(+)